MILESASVPLREWNGLGVFSFVTVFSQCVVFFRSLGPENLLLKGATLKNTQKIYGELQDIV